MNSTESGSTLYTQCQSMSTKQCDTGWIDAKCCGEGSTQHQDPTRNSYRPSAGLDPIPNMKTVTITSLTKKTRGSLYRMHMIRQEAAFELQTSVGEHGYITELDIDRYLIANYEPKRGEEARTEAQRQKWEATRKMARESYAKHYANDGITYVRTAQYHCPLHRSKTETSSTAHCRHPLT